MIMVVWVSGTFAGDVDYYDTLTEAEIGIMNGIKLYNKPEDGFRILEGKELSFEVNTDVKVKITGIDAD